MMDMDDPDDNVEEIQRQDFTKLELKQDHGNRPLWVCADGRIFLETSSSLYKQAYDFLIAIAEPVCRPEMMHEYNLTPHSLYAAVSVGLETETIITVLDRLSKTKLPKEIVDFIRGSTLNYGKVKLVLQKNRYFVESPLTEVASFTCAWHPFFICKLNGLLRDEVISRARMSHIEAPGGGSSSFSVSRAPHETGVADVELLGSHDVAAGAEEKELHSFEIDLAQHLTIEEFLTPLPGTQPEQAARKMLTDRSDLSLPGFLSSRFIQPTEDSLFSYGYVFREVEEELLFRYEKEGPVVMEHVSLEGLCEFLCIFFAPSVVDVILSNFLEMKNSGLGQEYFLRGGLSMLGLRTLNDITEEFGEFYSKHVAISENAGGSLQAQDSDWTVVTRSKSKQNRIANSIGGGSGTPGGSSNQGRGSNRGSDRGGRRGGGRRGRGRGNDYGGGGNRGEDIAFLEVSVVEILLPAFSTPDKHTLPSSEVRQTIGERSYLYSTKVQEYLQETRSVRFYAPELVQHGNVFLFHGMRQSSWSSFRRLGIRPRVVPNEFSTTGAFYLTNSLRQAFEHPLHQHPRRDTTDFISVLVFIVPVRVLHGQTSAPGGSDPFQVKWFQQANAEWNEFCYNNLVVRRLPNHSYDFVIGPSCLPAGDGSVSHLRMDGFAPTQIACCTDRAREWIASTASTIYMEKRQPVSDAQSENVETLQR